jgi:hypothetical protein
VLVPALAHAYIPPSEYLTRTMAQKRQALKSAKIRGVVLGLNSEGALTGARFIEETIYDGLTGTIRSFALDEQNTELYRMERSIHKESQTKDSATLVSTVLFETKPMLLINEFKRWDVPVKTEDDLIKFQSEEERRNAEKTFFGRQKLPGGLQVSWVIGDSKGNQLWIEKDTFLPVKILLTGSEKTEVNFDSFKVSREVPFPRVLSVTSEKELVFREEVQDVTINPTDLSDSRKAAGLGFTEAGNAVDSEVRELIRKYYKLVR